MFKFNFDIENDEEDEVPSHQSPTAAPQSDAIGTITRGSVKSNGKRKEEACYHITLDELMEKLPSSISYSPLHLPFTPSQPMLRRDLFDARFQLAEGEAGPSTRSASLSANATAAVMDAAVEMDGAEEEEEYIDSKTDLIPGLYEGGLKTWEGGVDLVEVINSVGDVGEWTRGAKILEVGCGTAIPSSFILRHLLSSPPPPSDTSAGTVLHLQDYNLPVLSLVTLPNLILATLPFFPSSTFTSPEATEADAESPALDWTAPGEVALTPRVLKAVRQLWRERSVQLRFTYGHWAGLADSFSSPVPPIGEVGQGEEDGRGYDLILTAETIYSLDSLPSLLQVLRSGQRRARPSSSRHAEDDGDLERSVEDLRITEGRWKEVTLREGTQGVVLVGAKVLYFGVGGDLHTFTQRVRESGGWVEEVMKWTSGVGRKVVRVGW